MFLTKFYYTLRYRHYTTLLDLIGKIIHHPAGPPTITPTIQHIDIKGQMPIKVTSYTTPPFDVEAYYSQSFKQSGKYKDTAGIEYANSANEARETMNELIIKPNILRHLQELILQRNKNVS